MDISNILAIAQKYLEHLKINNVLFEKEYLFVSCSKGNFNDDIDIAIVIKHLNDKFSTQVNLIKLTYKIDIKIEPNPIDFFEFNRNDHLSNKILNYGIEL